MTYKTRNIFFSPSLNFNEWSTFYSIYKGFTIISIQTNLLCMGYTVLTHKNLLIKIISYPLILHMGNEKILYFDSKNFFMI